MPGPELLSRDEVANFFSKGPERADTRGTVGHTVSVTAHHLGCGHPNADRAVCEQTGMAVCQHSFIHKSDGGPAGPWPQCAAPCPTCPLAQPTCSSPLSLPATSRLLWKGQQDRPGQGNLLPEELSLASKGLGAGAGGHKGSGYCHLASRLGGAAGLLLPSFFQGGASRGHPHSCRPPATVPVGLGPAQWRPGAVPPHPGTHHHFRHFGHNAPLDPPAPGKQQTSLLKPRRLCTVQLGGDIASPALSAPWGSSVPEGQLAGHGGFRNPLPFAPETTRVTPGPSPGGLARVGSHLEELRGNRPFQVSQGRTEASPLAKQPCGHGPPASSDPTRNEGTDVTRHRRPQETSPGSVILQGAE